MKAFFECPVLSRRKFLAQGSAALALASHLLPARAQATLAEIRYLEVNTATGRLRGAQTEGLSTFKGIPHGYPGPTGWPAYTTKQRPTMLIDAQCKVVDHPFGLEREAWERAGL